jgi:hypothetical protein
MLLIKGNFVKRLFLFVLVLGVVLSTSNISEARTMGSAARSQSSVIFVPVGPNSQRFIPQGVGPFLHDPNYSLYEWKIKDYPEYEPCYYNEDWGQWVGQCNLSLDTPGYSITVPNRMQR